MLLFFYFTVIVLSTGHHHPPTLSSAVSSSVDRRPCRPKRFIKRLSSFFDCETATSPERDRVNPFRTARAHQTDIATSCPCDPIGQHPGTRSRCYTRWTRWPQNCRPRRYWTSTATPTGSLPRQQLRLRPRWTATGIRSIYSGLVLIIFGPHPYTFPHQSYSEEIVLLRKVVLVCEWIEWIFKAK